MSPLCRPRDRGRAHRSLSPSCSGAAARLWGPTHQQRGGRDESGAARARAPAAWFRPGQARWPANPGPPRARRRTDDDSRRQGAQAQRRRPRHRRRREAGRACGRDGRSDKRGGRRDDEGPAGERDVRPGRNPPHLAQARAAHRGVASVRAGDGRANGGSGRESLRGADRAARRRSAAARCARRLPGSAGTGEGHGPARPRLGGARRDHRRRGGRPLAARAPARSGGRRPLECALLAARSDEGDRLHRGDRAPARLRHHPGEAASRGRRRDRGGCAREARYCACPRRALGARFRRGAQLQLPGGERPGGGLRAASDSPRQPAHHRAGRDAHDAAGGTPAERRLQPGARRPGREAL